MEIMVAIGVLVLILLVMKGKKKKEVETVPQGLQVFDENGRKVLDTSDRLTRVYGIVDIPHGKGQIKDARIKVNNSFLFVLTGGVYDYRSTLAGNLDYECREIRVFDGFIEYNNQAGAIKLLYGEF